MSRPRKTLATAAAAVAVGALAVAGALTPASAAPASPAAAATAPTYTVTVGAKGTFSYPTDTPASPYIDKDGTFYFQQSFSQYDAATSQNHYWQFFSGADFDSATKNTAISNAVNPANSQDSNANTVWRCQNSPTGVNATASSGYPLKNYCDLVGTWVDPDTGDWYGLVHNEFTGQPFGDGLHFDAIDYAVSHDQGKTWAITGHAITSPYSTTRGDTTAFPNQTYDYGDGDQRLYVDTASGYFYVYYGARIVPKGGAGGGNGGLAHVARAPLSGKMATGTWQKWYNGAWTQPGVGGLESNMVPTGTDANGYTPVAKDYSPANTGNADQQIAAGTLPPKSDLFIMNITYDAYLGLYLGEPELVDNGTAAPQKIYATADLSTQKWTLVGDTGSYTTSSWYRWFVDSVSKTNSMIVGKNYRAYCSISCSGGAGGEYVNETIDSSVPAAPPVDPAKTYTIGNGGGRILAQVSGSSATTSVAAATGSALESWAFASNGDGSFRITNASTGQALGVPVAAANRAWGTKPTVTALGTGGATVGQQWFIVPNTAQAGTYKIVNRYSGLVIGLSSDSTRLAETTPTRAWTNTTGNAVGGARTAAEQTLTFTVTGTSTGGNLNGAHTISTGGKALDDPNSSTATGTQLITWALHGGTNQQWTFTQQSDGAYTLKNNYSGLCADDNGGFTTPGTTVIQWTCTSNSNQHWTATKLANGSYTLTNVHTGLLLTTASASDGALVTQQANSGSALQQWTIS